MGRLSFLLWIVELLIWFYLFFLMFLYDSIIHGLPEKHGLPWTVVSCLMACILAAKAPRQIRFQAFWLWPVRIWSCNEVQPLFYWHFPTSAPFHLHLLHWLLTGHSPDEPQLKLDSDETPQGSLWEWEESQQRAPWGQAIRAMFLVMVPSQLSHFPFYAHLAFFPRRCQLSHRHQSKERDLRPWVREYIICLTELRVHGIQLHEYN